jgi:sugar transferase (PEP-CTERM/EpsH1 system associated)
VSGISAGNRGADSAVAAVNVDVVRPLIVHVVYSLGVGGLENGLVNLINSPLGVEYRHAIVCLTQASAFRERLQRADVDIFELHKPAGLGLGIYPRLWRLLRQLRPAIVHTNNLAALETQWVAALAGVKGRVHSEHGWLAADPQGQNPRHRWLRRVCNPVVGTYIAVSRDIARWLTGCIGLPERKVVLVPNGVDTQRFAPRSLPPAAVAPWPANATVIGCVARLDPVKAPLTLLAAYVALLKRRPATAPPLWLAWLGDGPERAKLEAAVAAAGVGATVWLPGARNDIPELLPQFAVFALASLNEGISYTVLEAMATGLPVVACAVGGNPEIVTSGTNGRLVPAGDVNGFADALADYVETPTLRQQHGEAGRATVMARFSFAAMQQAYAAIYARQCAGKQ